MTEYDFSPEAYERYMTTQNRIAKWVDQTEECASQFDDPGVPSDADVDSPSDEHGYLQPVPRRPPYLPLGYGHDHNRDLQQYSGSGHLRNIYASSPPNPYAPHYGNRPILPGPMPVPPHGIYPPRSQVTFPPNADPHLRPHSSYHPHPHDRHLPHDHAPSTYVQTQRQSSHRSSSRYSRHSGSGSRSHSRVSTYRVVSPARSPAPSMYPYQSYSGPQQASMMPPPPPLLQAPPVQVAGGYIVVPPAASRPYVANPYLNSYSTPEQVHKQSYASPPHEPLYKRIIHGIAHGLHPPEVHYAGHGRNEQGRRMRTKSY